MSPGLFLRTPSWHRATVGGQSGSSWQAITALPSAWRILAIGELKSLRLGTAAPVVHSASRNPARCLDISAGSVYQTPKSLISTSQSQAREDVDKPPQACLSLYAQRIPRQSGFLLDIHTFCLIYKGRHIPLLLSDQPAAFSCIFQNPIWKPCQVK
jgi:hypothetical protein